MSGPYNKRWSGDKPKYSSIYGRSGNEKSAFSTKADSDALADQLAAAIDRELSRRYAREYEQSWERAETSAHAHRQRESEPSDAPLEGELILAERSTYSPVRTVTSDLTPAGCVVRYRGAGLTLGDAERKAKSADYLRGTVAMFCRIIDNSKRIPYGR